jgi:ribosomal protein S18 acetylase RimI-like enzyme
VSHPLAEDDGLLPTAEADALPPGHILRQGTVQDDVALSWLIRTSALNYSYHTTSDLRDLLAREPSYLWLRANKLCAALLVSLYRQPVATVRALTLRNHSELPSFFRLILPRIESRLVALGTHWLSLSDPPAWLIAPLNESGYRLRDRVVGYHRSNLRATPEGNRKVLVHRAELEDIPAILAVDAEAFEPFWRINRRIAQQSVEDSPYALVARWSENVVGYLLAEPWNDEGYISRIGVLPAYQRQGIGTRLLSRVFALMEAHGLYGARLNTQEDNLRSQSLYERLGFRPTGETELIWAKLLDPAFLN